MLYELWKNNISSNQKLKIYISFKSKNNISLTTHHFKFAISYAEYSKMTIRQTFSEFILFLKPALQKLRASRLMTCICLRLSNQK